ALISSSNDKRLGKKRLQLASIIELLHTATLVHDDVVDESPTRRGIKSVNNIWSNSHGVLIGDYIYSKAFILMVELGNTNILDELSKATNDISKGELIQLDAINNKKITLSKLEDISYFKTGRLFEAAAKCGALLSRSDKKYQKSISDCAKNLGIVFQIKDDLLDYSQDESVTGKPALQDLREGKITYPFFFAYQNAKTNEKKQLELLLGKNKLNQKKTLNIINSLDGIKETENLALKYIKKSTKSALQIDNKNIREEMLNLLDAALYRKK
ncbi:polyprenyl synthetase family protein, partial [Gammaproteobacteria bacterium]|nr:polyprenyl synthetase family protein [Gammaproteobacteria bacterium]